MLYYHSFPRAIVDSADLDGLRILESILASGILLTPEELRIGPDSASDKKQPTTTTLSQRRACFTLLEREELLVDGGHTSLFGDFAIGLNTHRARKLGIIPTFYYYANAQEPSGNQDGVFGDDLLDDAGVSRGILHRLAEIRRVMIVLATIEAVAYPYDRDYKSVEYLSYNGLTVRDEESVAKIVASVRRRDAVRVAEMFDTDRVPAWNIAEWVEIILSAFQTADSKHRQRHLAYVAQREWRIIQLYANGILCIPLDTSKLSELGEEFAWLADEFAERVMADAPRAIEGISLDECFLLAGTFESRFVDFIDEVIVPARCHDEAEEILDRHDVNWPSVRVVIESKRQESQQLEESGNCKEYSVFARPSGREAVGL